jgi:serine/threonine protein kinase
MVVQTDLGYYRRAEDDYTSVVHPSRRESLLPEEANRKYGRHGDLKPENILWFKTYHNDNQAYFMGLLKISDFGMTSFHESLSRSKLDPKSLGVSPTYRAPEYDIKEHVSQSYDIWTLGCVLVEFVTWYLLGWDGVDGFSKSRTEDDTNLKDIPEDCFFNVEQLEGNGQPRFAARLKMSVANVGRCPFYSFPMPLLTRASPTAALHQVARRSTLHRLHSRPA